MNWHTVYTRPYDYLQLHRCYLRSCGEARGGTALQEDSQPISSRRTTCSITRMPSALSLRQGR